MRLQGLSPAAAAPQRRCREREKGGGGRDRERERAWYGAFFDGGLLSIKCQQRRRWSSGAICRGRLCPCLECIRLRWRWRRRRWASKSALPCSGVTRQLAAPAKAPPPPIHFFFSCHSYSKRLDAAGCKATAAAAAAGGGGSGFRTKGGGGGCLTVIVRNKWPLTS